jgi:uncharacterized Zn finger protein
MKIKCDNCQAENTVKLVPSLKSEEYVFVCENCGVEIVADYSENLEE